MGRFRRLLPPFLLLWLLLSLLPWALARSQKEEEGQTTQAAAPLAPGFLEARETATELEGVTLYDRATGELVTLSWEEFLPLALACEMDPAAPQEALKAQAVALRSQYTASRGQGPQGADGVCSPQDMEGFASEEALSQRWGEQYQENLALLQDACRQVAGQLLTWEGAPAQAVSFPLSAGATRQGEEPYLSPVPCPGDVLADGYRSTLTLTREEFLTAAGEAAAQGDFSGEESQWLTEVQRDRSGYVTAAKLGACPVTGEAVQAAFGLRSAAFSLSWDGSAFTFAVEGWGAGVGMSQAGASFLAQEGADYREILSYYFPGTELTEA